MKAIDNVIESEVLVVGSGLAGSLAAIRCHVLGNKTVVANKGPMVGGGATSIIGGVTMNVCLPGDGKEYWMKKFLELGGSELDREWLSIHLDDTYGYVLELDKLGQECGEAIFPRDPLDKSGGLWRLGPWGMAGIKNVVFHGSAAETAFRKKILAERIPFFARTAVTNLLTDGKRVVGAVGFNHRTGETYLFKAKAVIVACGGLRFDDALFITFGEGIAMAYEANARIRSLGKEKATFKPKHRAHIFGSLGDGYYSNGTTYPFDGTLVNRLGQVFMEKAPAGTNLEEAIRKEIAEGRGPIYEDWTQLPVEQHGVIKTLKMPNWKLTTSKYGLDPFQSRIPFPPPQEQVALPGRTSRFGVEVDHTCGSNIAGLYALGDSACHFTRKMPALGGGVAWALLTGSRVSRFVADYVASVPSTAITDKGILDQAKKHVYDLARPLIRTSGLSPDEVASRALQCLIPFDLVSLKNESMQEALRTIVDLQGEDASRVKAKDYHELKKAFDVRSLLLNAEIILRTQLFREQSVSASAESPTYTMVEKRAGEMKVYAKLGNGLKGANKTLRAGNLK